MVKDFQLHFFHGFLGEPGDWRAVINELKDTGCICHDLENDYRSLPQSDNAFEEWARLKESQLKAQPTRRILIGYSLGGRLCMHLNPDSYDQLILVAAHPGIMGDSLERNSQDQRWAELLLSLNSQDWVFQWNAQDVFRNDKTRPTRNLDGRKEALAAMLQSWSLARQEVHDEFLKTNRGKIIWVYGEKDIKFGALKSRMSSLLDLGHVIEVPEAGHGILFDYPTQLAEIIQQVAKNA